MNAVPPGRTPYERARDAEAERDRARLEHRAAERERDRAQTTVIALLCHLGGSCTIKRATLEQLAPWENLIESSVDVKTGDTTLKLVEVGRR